MLFAIVEENPLNVRSSHWSSTPWPTFGLYEGFVPKMLCKCPLTSDLINKEWKFNSLFHNIYVTITFSPLSPMLPLSPFNPGNPCKNTTSSNYKCLDTQRFRNKDLHRYCRQLLEGRTVAGSNPGDNKW